jgi:hypothetical protein
MIMLFDIILRVFIVILMNNTDLMLIRMGFMQIITGFLCDFLFIGWGRLVLCRFRG